jgi:DNA-directed RNA polymerase specialized sigma24 family protein
VARKKGKSRNRDADIIASVISGDMKAWERFVVLYAPNVMAVVRHVFNRYQEPMEQVDQSSILKQVFSKVAAGRYDWLKDFADLSRITPALHIIAAWAALGVLREKYGLFTCALRSEVKLSGRHIATSILAEAPEGAQAPCIDHETLEAMVKKYLKNVGVRQVRILKACYKPGQNYAAVAEGEGVPVPTVAQTVYEQRRKLAAALVKAAPRAGL